MEYLVYKITREDGKIYIGTTNTERLKSRMYHHKYGKIKGYNFTYEILEQNVSYEHIMNKETEYIKKFNSFKDGLNESFDGKGAHLNPKFTTLKYHHTEETKKKISNKLKGKKAWNKGKHLSLENRNKLSNTRKGKQSFTKLKKEDVISILRDFNNKIPLDDDRIGKIMKNGKCMTYTQVFCQKYGILYNISPQNIRRIVKRETWSVLSENV